MRYLVSETDLTDAFLLQSWPYANAAPPAPPPPFTEEDLFAATGDTYGFVETLPAKVPCNTLKDLHYQDPMPYGILLRVICGRILCLAQDMRSDAPTYQKIEAHVLSSEWGQLLWLPPGFAHGCTAIGEVAEITCALTEPYDPRHVRSVALPAS